MLTDIIKFATLGLGAGAIYGLCALGIVLIYRGSGVLNFAQGAVGMVGAYVFYLNRESGMPTPLAALFAIGVGALIGAITHLGVMRPLRNAPAVTRLIGTLAVFSFLYGFGQYRWGVNQARIVSAVLPSGSWEILPDIRIGTDRLVILAIGIVLTGVLTIVYRRTRFGLATAAVAENRRASAAVGVSPDVIATVNWVLGSVLAVCSAIMIVSIGTLQVESLTLLVFPALAAALLGGFKSYILTFVGGLLIGVLESEVAYAGVRWSIGDGWGKTVPFIVIIAVLMITGRALPMRGEATEEPPEIGDGEIQRRRLAIAVVVTLGMVWFWFSPTLLSAFEISMATALVVLSVVVVTGYAGQLSLAQMALAGMGAWIAARLVANWGVPFELALLAGVFGAIPIGLAVGLPALRTRGMNLAVVTLGLAIVVEAQILGDPKRTGGFVGTVVGAPSFLGIDMDTYAHPERYAVFCFVIFVLFALMVANLRRGRAGRRLVAVRANERAAASLGISVVHAKLYAFSIGAGLAACGGVLLAFRQPTVVFVPTFTAFQSIFVIVFAVIGGIGFLVGALIGGLNAPSGFLGTGLSTILDGPADSVADFIARNEVAQMVLGLTLVLILLQLPNGLATHPLPPPIKRAVERRRERKGTPPRVKQREPIPEPSPFTVMPRTVRIDGLTVRFGGVVAADSVTMVLRPGEVHGLIGPNGAGKTTAIDAVTGFVPLAEGTVRLDDDDITGWPAQRRARAGISRSFQSLELFETMTVRENLLAAGDRHDQSAFLTNLVRPGRDEYTPAALAAIHEFDLEPDLERRPQELSYGRRRLVAIARAVASGSSVLLLDEPAAGLDDTETAELGRLIVRLAKEWGIAVLLVEHNVSVVLDVSDQISVLNFGKVIANGTPAEIRNNPEVIAAYLGAEDVGGDAPTVDASALDDTLAVARVISEPIPVSATTASSNGSSTGARSTAGPQSALALVEAVDVSAGYGDLAAVRDLNLRVEAGEVVALLGPNGAGKTTTLLTLAGELRPMSGAVLWRGDGAFKPLHRRSRDGLGFVSEERSVFMQLDAADNLRLGAGGIDAAVDIFPELGDLLNRRAGLLSGGEQQMLTLARALAAEPTMLLADELSLGLAPLVVERLFAAVRRAADSGVGVLLVEQQVGRALEVADRVYVLRRGVVEFEGTPDDVRADRSRIQDAYLSAERADAGARAALMPSTAAPIEFAVDPLDPAHLLPNLVARRAVDAPDRTFLVDTERGSVTYAEFHEQVTRWAGVLAGLGVAAGDRVAVMLPTSITEHATWLACVWHRALQVPINTAYRGQMLAHVLADAGATIAIATPDYAALIDEVRDRTSVSTVVIVDGRPTSDHHRSADDLYADAPPAPDPTPATASDIAAVIYTSGTTGPSKGVLVPWGQLATGVSAFDDFGPGDVLYAPFAAYHLGGKLPLQLLAYWTGTFVFRDGFRTQCFWDDVRTHGCNRAWLFHAMANFVHQLPPRPDDLDNPLETVSGGPMLAAHRGLRAALRCPHADQLRIDRTRLADLHR